MTWEIILSAMLMLRPIAQNDKWRGHEYASIAKVIERTCGQDSWCDAVLISVGHHESGYKIRARGKLGEVGPWQLLGANPAMRLTDQAKEAWRRWTVQGAEGYTGEGKCPCPLAVNRRLLAAIVQSIWGNSDALRDGRRTGS